MVQAIDKLGSIVYFIARPFVVHEVEELADFDTARAAPFYYLANSCIQADLEKKNIARLFVFVLWKSKLLEQKETKQSESTEDEQT